MSELKEKIENLRKQQEQAKEIFVKHLIADLSAYGKCLSGVTIALLTTPLSLLAIYTSISKNYFLFSFFSFGDSSSSSNPSRTSIAP